MARALKIQFDACRGNERRSIYRDDADRTTFLELLERSLELYDVRLLCYTLMSNHFHPAIQPLRPWIDSDD
jgi:REP element-mobilizing transposase RayT